MDWLEGFLTAWFPMIAILAVFAVVFGFLGHSIGKQEPDDSPPTRGELYREAAFAGIAAAAWAYLAWSAYANERPWYIIGLFALGSLFGFVAVFRDIRAASQAA
ncbi:MAG: hypothetical protein AAF697_07625 [Pseudomonadota bacterium]